MTNMFNIITSSSVSNFWARRLAHFRSKHLREAPISALRGTSTAVQSANSHKQSTLDRVVAVSREFIRDLSIEARDRASMPRIDDTVGIFPGSCSLSWVLLESSLGKDGSFVEYSSMELSSCARTWDCLKDLSEPQVRWSSLPLFF